MNIVIRKEETKTYGNQLLENVREFSRQINEYSRVISDINTAWDAPDALKYINTMRDKYLVSLNELRDILRDYAVYLRDVGNAYETLDNTFASKSIDV